MTVSKDVINDVYELGGKDLAETASRFLDAATTRGMDLPDAILLFVTLLLSQSVAVVKAMVPDDSACEEIVTMVREQWGATETSHSKAN